MATCSECLEPVKAKGLCASHYLRAYRAANAELLREADRVYAAANAERRREVGRAYRAANAERRHKTQRAYYVVNADGRRESSRAYRAAHPLWGAAYTANFKARMRGVPGVLNEKGLMARFAYFGGRCWLCGRPDADSIDHVKPFGVGGPNHHSNIRPACLSCNKSRKATWKGLP